MPHSGCLLSAVGRSLAVVLARASLLSALLVALAGCAAETFEGNYTCLHPDEDYVGPDGVPDPCHDRAVKAECDVGEFVHYPTRWDSPTLLWFGPEEQAPECPLGPITTGYEGHTNLLAPGACEACSCELPTGSCALPSTIEVQADVCGPQVDLPIDWKAPAPWDGLCDEATQVVAGKAYSLKIPPLTMAESGCASGPTVPAKVLASQWQTYARTCDMAWPPSPVGHSICLTGSSPVPADFRLCISHDGELPCPATTDNVFTEQHVFYNGIEDDRQCSPCTCGAPAGSTCTAIASIYTNATCSGVPLTQTTISSASETCVDVQLPGQALGSKSASLVSYLPGTCPPAGGDASGTAIATEPVTYCCRPDTY